MDAGFRATFRHFSDASPIFLRTSVLDIFFTTTPQALVTTDAVKFKAIGMFTFDHIGSTVEGFEDGTAPAS